MAKQRRPKTAAELLAELARDKDYIQKRSEREAQRAVLEAELAQDEAPLLADLGRAGVAVSSVWDLVNTETAYPAAIPVLLEHLQRQHHLRTREGIVRALTAPESRGIGFAVIYREFLAASAKETPELKWLLGAALAEATDEPHVGQVIDLLRSREHGKGREFLLTVLRYLDERKRVPILDSLASDPDLGNAIKALKLGR
jgi:hypothetical protein